MFSTKISLAKGIRSKTGAAHPRHNFSEYQAPPAYQALPGPGVNQFRQGSQVD